MTNNYSLHNDKVKSLWSMFNQGKAERVPVIVGVSSRFILLSEFAKAKGITFEEYHNNPETMFTIQLELERFRKFEIDDDTQKGVPEEDGQFLWICRMSMKQLGLEQRLYSLKIMFRIQSRFLMIIINIILLKSHFLTLFQVLWAMQKDVWSILESKQII